MSRELKFAREGEAEIQNPTLDQVLYALDNINPKISSFFTLVDSSGNYVQTAGAKLRLIVEYRRVHGDLFQHFVMGQDLEDKSEKSINYSGGAIKLQANEILNISKAKEIFERFYKFGTVPSNLLLRDITQSFLH
jgi:hypothetical protein